MLENDLSRNITYKLFQFTSTNLVSYRPQNLPLRMSCWPVVAASQSASLAMLILCSSILCQLLLLPAMALPSPTMPSLARSTIWFALTTAREILCLILPTSSPICLELGGTPRSERVRTLQAASTVTRL